MTTVADIIEFYNIPIKFNDTLLNQTIERKNWNEGKYTTETRDGNEIHVITIGDKNSEYYGELILDENKGVYWDIIHSGTHSYASGFDSHGGVIDS